MKIRKLEREDVRDAVRILLLFFEKVFYRIFGDLELARELFFEYFEENTDGCYVAEEERIVGFAYTSSKKQDFGKFFRRKLGFVKGTKIGLLLSYICPKPKRDELVINFLAISPLRMDERICLSLLEKIAEDAVKDKKKRIKCLISIENELLDTYTDFGFKIKKVFDSRFAEKNFGVRVWNLMELEL